MARIIITNLGNKDVFAKNLKKYMQLNGKTRNEVCQAPGLKYTTFTKLKDFADMYIRTYKAPVVSEKWLQGLFLIYDRHIVGSLGNRPISTIKPLEVQKTLNSLDVSSNYMTKIYNLTCQIFRHAYKNGLTATDYTDGLEKPKGRKANTQKKEKTPAFRREPLL